MNLPDDMVITPRFKRSNNPREVHVEQRRNEETKRQIRKRRMRMRLSIIRRRQAAGRGARRGGRATKRGLARKGMGQGAKFAAAKGGAKFASRAVPVVGWAMLLLDVVMLGHEYGRRTLGGKSARLVEREDAHAMWGEMQNEFINNANTRDFFESDASMLRAIGSDGKMNSSMRLLRDTMLQEDMKRVQGADIIHRDPYFDSPDSLLDKALAKWKDEAIPDLAQETITKMRTLGYGNTKSGR